MPNILYGKTFFTEKFGSVDFKTNALYKNYEVDKHISSVTNDVVWNSNSFITSGLVPITLRASSSLVLAKLLSCLISS